MSDRLNILYLHCHDAGRHIQPFGYACATPNLQSLAEQGIFFRNAHCAAPTCSPSRAALLTGRYAHEIGMLGLAHRGWKLDDYGDHLVQLLNREGYMTALCGIQHEASHLEAKPSDTIGYQQLLTPETEAFKTASLKERDSLTADAAATWLESRTVGEKPFFLAAGFFLPHRPYVDFDKVKPFENPDYIAVPSHLPDNPETRKDLAHYNASIAHADSCYGKILDALERTGFAKTTLIVATTDHGIAFPGMKCNLTDKGTGVHLIIKGPGPFCGGKVIDAMVSHLDVFPTLCQAIGKDLPANLRGKPLQSICAGETDRLHDYLYSEVTYHSDYEPMRAIRSERYKFIERFDPEQTFANTVHCDNGPSKAVLMANGWSEQPVARIELYDLIFDPNECRNLACEKAYAEIRNDLQTRLKDWMTATADPLLAGPVADPFLK